MRSALLSSVRQMTSSRQSPRMSADSAGVAFVPLFDATPSPVSSRVSPSGPYLSMWVPSSSSRVRSPSHQLRKLALEGLGPISSPAVFRSAPSALDQNSAPGLPSQMSPPTPRPLSLPLAVSHRISPVPASRSSEPGLLESSETLNSSSPSRAGSRSPRCCASPCPVPAFHSGLPSSSIAMEPYAISSLPSPSRSPTDRLCEPWPSYSRPASLLSKTQRWDSEEPSKSQAATTERV